MCCGSFTVKMYHRTKILLQHKTYLDHQEFFSLYDDFISESYSGRRLTKKGERLSIKSIENYEYTKKLLLSFCAKRHFEMRIYIYDNLTAEQREEAAQWYIHFYNNFKAFVLYDQQLFDNYLGNCIKIIRAFFNYVDRDRDISIGDCSRYLHRIQEQVQIVVLSPDQLQYIIHSKEFEMQLSEMQLQVRDIFIVGCTVGLRYSDLMRLTVQHLETNNGAVYLTIKNKKTKISTTLKLPPYVQEIIARYAHQYATLLPCYSLCHFNKVLKQIGKFLPEDFVLPKIRERNGNPVIIYKDAINKVHYHISDHISSHTMRRTAITSMMILGVPEHIVRQISGHTPNSKEFFRYVKLTQLYFDNATDKAFEKLCNYNPYNPKSILDNN